MIFGGRVVRKSENSGDRAIDCELTGRNQEGKEILTGSRTLILPRS
jgi:hypothetical protein